MEVKPLQPEKALRPILVTLLGIVLFLHPDINVLDDVSMIALQLLRESYTVLLLTTISVRLLQSDKTLCPMVFTLLGIVIEFKALQ